MDKEGFIENVTNKLLKNEKLNSNEISAIRSALRESNHCFQEPYYEVIYHDKYDNTETRTMEPITSCKSEDMGGYSIQEDHFNLYFRRIIREED